MFIPSHLSILHVEQEVIGDDTPAIESVLECDKERHELLQEEKMLTGSSVAGRYTCNISISFIHSL